MLRMRTVTLLAMMALMTVSLSGCLGFGDDDPKDEDEHGDDHDHCDGSDALNHSAEECPDDDQDGDDGNETEEPPAPNELPTAVLTMTGPDGVLNATSHVLPGANVTFSAAGSSDPDGEVALAGLTVTDSNGTRTAQLFQDGAFANATFQFGSVGPVNVTIRVLDDDGEGVIRVGSFAVNDLVQKTEEFTTPAPTGSADDCEPPASGTVPPLATNNFAAKSTFSVQRGAQWIEATVTSGDASIAICSPDGEALSGAGSDSVATEDDTNSTLAVNAQYYVMVLAGGSGGEVGIDILVHYEPKA